MRLHTSMHTSPYTSPHVGMLRPPRSHADEPQLVAILGVRNVRGAEDECKGVRRLGQLRRCLRGSRSVEWPPQRERPLSHPRQALYLPTVTYEGYAEDGVARTSVGFVCDETARVVSANISPVRSSTLETASPGHASVHEGLTISWAGVFSDRESFLERAEVCFSVSQLTGPLSLCQPEDWLPVTGEATSYTVDAPLPTRIANSSAVVARVRQFNRVGHFAVAESAEVVLSAEKPTLSWLAIGDWTSTDRSGIPVRWGASLGARNYLLEVCEADCEAVRHLHLTRQALQRLLDPLPCCLCPLAERTKNISCSNLEFFKQRG